MVDGVPGRLDEAVLQSLRRDPASRFRSADAMRVAIDAAVNAVEADREDVTRVVPTSAPGTARAPGYVPPPAPAGRPAPASRSTSPARRASAPAREPRRRPPAGPRRAGSVWGLLGTLLVLGVAALVVVLVIVPLLQLGQGGGAGPGTSPTSAPTSPSDPSVVVVPQVVGQPTADAIARAREAGLNWTVRCAQDPSQPEGIIDQEPPAGTEVARGSAFTMFSARISDCR
jgi:hypothetical protein